MDHKLSPRLPAGDRHRYVRLQSNVDTRVTLFTEINNRMINVPLAKQLGFPNKSIYNTKEYSYVSLSERLRERKRSDYLDIVAQA